MKFSPIILLLALSLALFPSSRAQEENPTLGLSEDDYDLLQQAIENTDEANSFQLTYSANLSITATTTCDQSLEVAGSGSIIAPAPMPVRWIKSLLFIVWVQLK